jgi:MOSC domain-containing protein YiiM
MKLLSVNTGSLCSVIRNGKRAQSGIFKQPVDDLMKVHRLGLEGDQQANKKLHGGILKAICIYPSEHYEIWRDELEKPDLSFGDFGENLTTLGLLENSVCLGDRFRIGSAEMVVTQPREPCVTLNARLHLKYFSIRFKESGRSGFYFSVVKEGSLKKGDSIECIFKDENRVSIKEFNDVLNGKPGVNDIMRRACKVKTLPKKLKNILKKRIET